MERKIGEIFEYNDEFFQCVESSGCALCAFNEADCNDMGCCEVNTRRDRKSVIFKRLEKVGEPFMIGKVLYQHYKAFDIDNVCRRDGFWCIHNYKAKTLTIELTQNKEDMEENNNAKHSNSENIGKNLREFDLEAAKAGKLVCTRDGRKAIFLTTLSNKNFPVVAIVSCGQEENIYQYDINGVCDEHDDNLDLMMLPEKKEGWVNLYRDEESKRVYCGEFIFSEREKAEKYYKCNDTKVATVSIGWEE